MKIETLKGEDESPAIKGVIEKHKTLRLQNQSPKPQLPQECQTCTKKEAEMALCEVVDQIPEALFKEVRCSKPAVLRFASGFRSNGEEESSRIGDGLASMDVSVGGCMKGRLFKQNVRGL